MRFAQFRDSQGQSCRKADLPSANLDSYLILLRDACAPLAWRHRVHKMIIIGFILVLLATLVALPTLGDTRTPPRIVEFLGDQPMTRVGRPFVMLACLANPADVPVSVVARLVVPEGVQVEDGAERPLTLQPSEEINPSLDTGRFQASL